MIEDMKTCDGCIYKPVKGENYLLMCGECARWYGDQYEKGTADEKS